MPSKVMDQRGITPMYAPSEPSSFFSDEASFPAERHVGFWKPEPTSDLSDTELMSASGPVTSSPHDKNLRELIVSSAKSLESAQWGLGDMVGDEKINSVLGTPWKPTSNDFLVHRSNHLVQPANYFSNGSKVDLNVVHLENGSFSSSLSEIFNKKVTLSSNNNFFGNSNDTTKLKFEEEIFASLEEMEARTIGNLLPDDDDLFDYISQPNTKDYAEEDIFCTVGGMDIEDINSLGSLNGLELSNITSNDPLGELNSYSSGKHPYGELPSRTLFVRNINSNIEDTELRDLFEQYGDIHTLYTACKHRGFVMISYYDIRSACNAMKELQTKPLRRRNLDIHFSIPKDNPSEKDINQGTLAVFNLESSVSNDELCQIFGVHGEIKEIHETHNQHHYKLIEFYDVRASEAALHALDMSDIAGKQIKLESSFPGGLRNSIQKLSLDLQKDEIDGCRQQSSPKKSLTGNYESISIGEIVSGGSDSTNVHGFQPVSQSPVNSSVDGIFNGTPSNTPHNFPSMRSGSFGNHSDFSHSPGMRNFGFHPMQNFHPHSLPENQGNIPQRIPYNMENSISTMAANISRSTEDIDNRNISVGLARFGGQNVSGNGGYTVHGHQFAWQNSFHNPTGPVLWPNSPSFANHIPRRPTSQVHRFTATPAPHHNVGSAPTSNPSLWDRHHAYAGEPIDASAFHPSSLESMGYSGSPTLNHVEHGSHSIFPHVGGNFMEPPIPPMHIGMSSPHQNFHIFHGRSGMISMPNTFDFPGDRTRIRRGDISSNQGDNKRQYELDIERIISGEDTRTTLMIKNIPNKYTSKMLLSAIDEHHRGTYDFIYLPIDFKNKCNVGYAFINMINPQQIIPIYKVFNGKKWEKFNSEKVASLAYGRIQGKAALIAHFQNSSLMNEDKRCRPILFHSVGPNAGDQEPFPMGVNIRSRPGRSKNHNNDDHHQDDMLNSVTEMNSNGFTSSSSSTKDLE